MKSILFTLLICALVATTLGRENQADTLRDLLNTIQEGQTLGADVEAYKKVSGGLTEKVNEMKKKLSAQHTANRNTYNQGVAERKKAKAEAEGEKKEAEAEEAKVKADARKTRAEQTKLWNAIQEENKAVEASVSGIIAGAKQLAARFPTYTKKIVAAAEDARRDQKSKSDKVKRAYDREMARVQTEEADAEKAVKKTVAILKRLLKRQAKEARKAREDYNNNKMAIDNEIELCEQILALVSKKSGWVKIGTITTPKKTKLKVHFDDKGMKYNKIRLVNRGGSITDFSRVLKKTWESHGFDIGKNAIKLDGKWYHSSYAPHKCGSHKYHALDNKKFKIIKRNKVCYWDKKRKTDACGNVVEIDTDGRRFQGISDVETLGGCWTWDNQFRYNFDVYAYIH